MLYLYNCGGGQLFFSVYSSSFVSLLRNKHARYSRTMKLYQTFGVATLFYGINGCGSRNNHIRGCIHCFAYQASYSDYHGCIPSSELFGSDINRILPASQKKEIFRNSAIEYESTY